MADLFLLSNVAAINTRGGSMQRQAEAQKFRNPEDNGKHVGERESETRTGQFNTVNDVVSLSQDVKSLGQARLSTSAFLLLNEMEQAKNRDENPDPIASLFARMDEDRPEQMRDRRRAFLAYSQVTQSAAASLPAQEEIEDDQGRASKTNLRPHPSFSLIV
jgi:hypothetical protein